MTTTYQQMQQPQQPYMTPQAQAYKMPPQAQAMPPAQEDLPWEVSPAAGIPQAAPQDQQRAPYGYGPGEHPHAPRARKEVKPGNYTCALADIREGTTKSGMPRISIAWRILPGQGDMSGLWIWDNVTLGTPKGYEILALKLAHICPGWQHADTADMYDEARQVRGWAHGHEYSVSYVQQENGFFRVYADLIR